MPIKDKSYFIEWLEQIKDEAYRLVRINVIGHDVNRIIKENKELSRDSDLWAYIDNSFVCNVIINITKILEPPRGRDGDRSFSCFLKQLNPVFILSEQEYASMFIPSSGDFIGDGWTDKDIELVREEHYTKRSIEYSTLTKGVASSDYLESDTEELEKLFNVFRKFRIYYVAHMKASERIDPIQYDDVTNAIDKVVELVTKYSILLDGTRPVYLRYQPRYGNVFEIPWQKSG